MSLSQMAMEKGQIQSKIDLKAIVDDLLKEPQKFARTRTFLRIRALNAKLKDIDIEKSWKQRQKKIAQFKN